MINEKMPGEEKFFTIEEVVRYLKIPKSTIYKLSQKGSIPSSKIGKQLRFRKSSLDKWLARKESGLESPARRVFSFTESANSKLKRVLLVDDDDLVLRSVATFLRGHGYNVVTAESGQKAVEEIKKLNFDLLIIDVRMPGMDGIETVKKIREFHAQNNRPDLPEIIISGYIDPEAQRQAAQLGITDYLHKPFAINEFIKAIKEKMESNYSAGLKM